MSGLWELHPRNKDLTRTMDPVSGWESLELVERFNTPDTWTVQGPSAAMGQVLGVFTPGMGCILDRDGQQITSGIAKNIVRSSEKDESTGRIVDWSAVSFVSDDIRLYDRAVFPQPSKVLTGTPSAMSSAYDSRTGAIETLILGYIASNLGPAAPVTGRRLSSLVLPATLGRGGTTTVNARMNYLGVLVHDLAEAGRLRVRVQHDESSGSPRLALTITEAPDLSADVRFGPLGSAATGVVETWRYEISAPETTRAIAWAEGSLEERLAAQITESTAESLWGRQIERVLDVQWSSDGEEIARSMVDALDEGASPVTVSFTIGESADLTPRVSYDVGAKVGVELPELPAGVSDNVIREMKTTARHGEELVEATVGTPGATTQSTKQAVLMAKALSRLGALERNA